MLSSINNITVYGASSSRIDPEYIEAAKQLGVLMSSNKITCINGGGGLGMMGAITDSILSHGGDVIGVIPQFMVDEGWVHKDLQKVIITPDMHTRKQLMAEKSDACIALPGGIGTFEELLEIMTWKQLGLYQKPVIILNVKGYYNHLLEMLKTATEENFMHHKHQTIWDVASTPVEALELAVRQKEWYLNPRSFAAL